MKNDEKLEIKSCPICGHPAHYNMENLPEYEGCCNISYSCSGCGLIHTGGYIASREDFDEMQQKAVKQWNDRVDEIADFIEHKDEVKAAWDVILKRRSHKK